MNMQNKVNKGFTMIEMLTVVTIMVILMTTVIPGWRNFVQNNQAAAIASKLYMALNLARTTAIQSGERVVICPVSQPAGTTCLDTTQWDAWILFTDRNTNSTIDSGETIKTYYDYPSGVITANSSGLIYFDNEGFASANRVFNILPPGCVGNNGRSVTVRQDGNIQIDPILCP